MRSVYMMKTSHDLYKIGIATDVEKRLKSHQTSNGNKVLLVTYARCGNAVTLEHQAHVMLKDHVQPGGREWFKLTPEQAIKVCIFIHQKAEYFHSEDDIRQLLDEYATHHESIVNAKQSMEQLSQQIGTDIQKAIGRLHRFKPAPKVIKPKAIPKPDNDNHLFEEAIKVIKAEQGASTSLLQRKLRIGYGRAARLMEELEGKGIIGAADGIRRREVFIAE